MDTLLSLLNLKDVLIILATGFSMAALLFLIGAFIMGSNPLKVMGLSLYFRIGILFTVIFVVQLILSRG